LRRGRQRLIHKLPTRGPIRNHPRTRQISRLPQIHPHPGRTLSGKLIPHLPLHRRHRPRPHLSRRRRPHHNHARHQRQRRHHRQQPQPTPSASHIGHDQPLSDLHGCISPTPAPIPRPPLPSAQGPP